MPNPYLLPGLQRSAEAIRQIVHLADPARHDEKTDPERFSFREAIAHLADWEPVMRGRIQTAATNPGAQIPDWDEGQMAIDHDYANQDPLANADRFLQQRLETIALLATLTPDQWQGTVTHPVRGTMTAYDWANTTLGHDAYHTEHFLQYLPKP